MFVTHDTEQNEQKKKSIACFFQLNLPMLWPCITLANFTKALIQKYKWISIDSYRNRLAMNRGRSLFVRMNWKEFHNVQSYRNHIVIHESSSTYMIVGSLFNHDFRLFFLRKWKKKTPKNHDEKKNTEKHPKECI